MKGLALTAAAVAAAAMAHGAPLTIDEVRADDPRPANPPDRLSVDRDSPFFDECYKRVGVRLNGVERLGDVQEYCVSEGWIDVRRRNGRKFAVGPGGEYLLSRLPGDVVAYFKDNRPTRATAPAYRQQTPESAKAALDAAAAKRARRAEKIRKQMGEVDDLL